VQHLQRSIIKAMFRQKLCPGLIPWRLPKQPSTRSTSISGI